MTITDERRRNIKVPHVLFVEAAFGLLVATFGFLSVAHPTAPATGVASLAGIVADGDDNLLNDSGQTSGDIFQQNARTQGD